MVLNFSKEWRLKRKVDKAWEAARQEDEKRQQLLKTCPITDPSVTKQQMAHLTALAEHAKARKALLEWQRARGKEVVTSILDDLQKQIDDLKKQSDRTP